jgi:hypothetical protein
MNRVKENTGPHWTCIVTDDSKRAIYFDSYGENAPNEIRNLLKSKQYKIGHTKKKIQFIMSNLCGFFCLAFIYFLSVFKFTTGNTINDGSNFLDLFEDLDKVDDIYKNEFILSLFFTDKKSKSLLLGNNNVEMTKQNKLTNSYDIEDNKIRS